MPPLYSASGGSASWTMYVASAAGAEVALGLGDDERRQHDEPDEKQPPVPCVHPAPTPRERPVHSTTSVARCHHHEW